MVQGFATAFSVCMYMKQTRSRTVPKGMEVDEF